MTEKAYGLGIPKEAMLRKFLQTMTHGNEVRKFLIPNLERYEDVRALATAVEALTSEEQQWTIEAKTTSTTARCRVCGRTGHLAAACPTKSRRPPPRSAPAAAAATAAAELEYGAEEAAEEAAEYCEE